MKSFHRLPLVAVLASVLLSGCESDTQSMALPAPTVEVVSATASQYQPVKRFSGRIEAIEDIGVSAQVAGYLTERWVEDGQWVEAGAPLFEIDPRPYHAALEAAKGSLAEALAARDIAKINLKRNRQLLGKGSVSQSDIDNLTASLAMAEARVLQAEAAREMAELNLHHTRVLAPIAGQVGAANASVGDLVGPQSGALITLVQQDPMRASFRISERERLALVVNGLMENDKIEVMLDLGQGQTYSHPGLLSFIDNRIEASTGTLAMHADFANPEHLLMAGQYVQVQVRPKGTLEGLMIPNAAVQSDQQGSFVMVVDDQQVVERRNVELGERLGQDIVVLSNLEAGERVVVAGLHRTRAGGKVTVAGEQE
ncbi:efflux RND transporter periplasmic adaptor subunit [Ferrimonas gelatinilytica]|uniref:Multidrug efflux RND transporter periplasmic adaptor subunit VmeY n=1 Tax=Ferrimonas gelatinilytica TaxID=1255257 RepID=A0ABP9S6A5_9GAMM